MPESSAGRSGPRGAIALALLHALLMAFAFPERVGGVALNLWPLAFLVPVPLALLALEARRLRTALFAAGGASTLAWLWTQRWLVDVTLAGWPLLALYMALWPCLFIVLLRAIVRAPRTSGLPLALTIPLVWIALETVRGEVIWHGYPWFLLGQPLVEAPVLAQAADLVGVYGVGLLAVLPAAVLVAWLRGTTGAPFVRLTVAVAVVHAANLAYGAWRLAAPAGPAGPRVLAIQTNLPQSNKVMWSREAQVRDVGGFLAQTRRGHAESGGATDLVVWPETMLPVRGLEVETIRTLTEYRQEYDLAFIESVVTLGDEIGAPMLVGAPCYLDLDVVEEDDGARWDWSRSHNSAYLVHGDPPYQRFDKIHLTPFGEVMPYVSAWPWLEQRLLGVGAAGMSFDLSPADTVTRLDLPDGGTTLATPICFEDTIARVCRRLVWEDGAKRAGLLVNLSNDGWFGERGDGRVQHAQAARFRCIENRVPMVRCVNTGATLWIDSCGRLAGRVGADRGYGEIRTEGWLAADVVLDERRPLARITGEAAGWACVVAVLGMALAARFGRRKSLP